MTESREAVTSRRSADEIEKQHSDLMAYFDQIRPELAADPLERARTGDALRKCLYAFEDLGDAIRESRR